MKLQYRIFETASFKFNIGLYHNGALVEIRKVWETELGEEVDKLEEQGYTYGYTKEEIEVAKRQYEHKLKNAL